jgi:putative transposase
VWGDMIDPSKLPRTVFTIGSEDRVRFAERFFTAEPYPNGYVLREVEGNGRFEFEDWQISEHVSRQIIEIEKGYFGIDAMNARALKYALDTPNLPQDVVYRMRMVHMFLEGVQNGRWKRSKECVKEFYGVFDAIDAEHRRARGGTDRVDATDKNRVAWRQFLRIVKLFEQRGRTPNALVKNYTGQNLHTKDVNYELEAYMRSWAAKKATRHKTSAEALYGEMVSDNEKREVPFKLPDVRTFQRRVKALEYLRVQAGMNSPDAAKARLAISQGGLEITRPLERVEMDEKVIDLIVLLMDTGIWDALHADVQKVIRRVKRPYVSVAMDHASRSILAMRLLREAPKASTAIETLRMALLPKTEYAKKAGAQSDWPQCGTMECVSTDAGSSWSNEDFQACVLMTTGRHLIPPSKTPILRGTIERFFKTVDDRYMHVFSGRTFGNVVARGNYNAVANASMEFEDLADALVRLIVDCYHHTPHDSLNGETPMDAWSRLNKLYRVKPFPTREEMAQIFSLTINRKIGDNGLVFLGIPYGNEPLQRLRNLLGGATVQMRVDTSNLGSVRMLTQDGRGYVTIPCMRHGFEGVSAQEWLAVLRTIDKRFADRSKIHDETVRRTMSEVKAMSSAAMAGSGIAEPILSQEEYERAERQLVRGWVVPGRPRPDYPDLSDGPAPSPLTSEASTRSSEVDERRKTVLGMGDAPTEKLSGLRTNGDGRPAFRPAPDGGKNQPLPPSGEAIPADSKTAAPSRRWTFEKK